MPSAASSGGSRGRSQLRAPSAESLALPCPRGEGGRRETRPRLTRSGTRQLRFQWSHRSREREPSRDGREAIVRRRRSAFLRSSVEENSGLSCSRRLARRRGEDRRRRRRRRRREGLGGGQRLRELQRALQSGGARLWHRSSRSAGSNLTRAGCAWLPLERDLVEARAETASLEPLRSEAEVSMERAKRVEHLEELNAQAEKFVPGSAEPRAGTNKPPRGEPGGERALDRGFRGAERGAGGAALGTDGGGGDGGGGGGGGDETRGGTKGGDRGGGRGGGGEARARVRPPPPPPEDPPARGQENLKRRWRRARASNARRRRWRRPSRSETRSSRA